MLFTVLRLRVEIKLADPVLEAVLDEEEVEQEEECELLEAE